MSIDEASSTVWLLGAGFSRAISEDMPLINELGQAVARAFSDDCVLKGMLDRSELDAIDDDRVPFGDVEVWLTSLASDQPFLSASRNLQRRAMFVELASLIAHQIKRRQRRAGQQPWPQWFEGLVAHWHEHKSDVITLNYDTLIESALRTLHSQEPKSGWPWPNDILGSFPPAPPQRGMFAEEVMDSFALHKLHGSINWFGRLRSGDMLSIVRFDSLTPEWGQEECTLNRAMTALKDSLDSVILPPVAAKSSLYGNPTMTTIWQRAYSALRDASRIVVFGYSIPQADASILSLLASSVTPATRITIVNPSPGDVANRLASLGLLNTEVAVPPHGASPLNWSHSF